jgi:hypothetical protein
MKVAAETPKGDNPKTNGVVKTPASVKTRSGRTIKRSPTKNFLNIINNDTLQHYVHFNKK